MKHLRKNLSKTKRGFTLIESLVLLFIFALVGVVFLQVYAVGGRLILESKNRLGATALANQKMEIIRSIAYDEIGTKSWNGTQWVYGIPAGELLQSEDVAVNTRTYRVTTSVQYVDDAFDGVTPADTIPTDYKRVRIVVSWGEYTPEQQVVIFGDFMPEGIEAATSGGTLSINVLNAAGSGVGGASVRVVNTAKSIDATYTTDSTGNITLPGSPAGSQSYQISVSKTGYFGAMTYAPYPTSTYDPVDVHASVVANTLNQFSIVMDQDIDFKITTVDPFDQAIPSVGFDLVGGRLIGTSPSNGASTYSLNATSQTTNASGEKSFTNQSYGVYTFTSHAPAQYEFYKLLPETTGAANQYDGSPGANDTVKAVYLDTAVGSVKVIVEDAATDAAIADASVHLSNGTLNYSASGTTDQFGQTYFPTDTTPLAPETYTVDVSATGYADKSDTVTVNTTLQTATLKLNAN